MERAFRVDTLGTVGTDLWEEFALINFDTFLNRIVVDVTMSTRPGHVRTVFAFITPSLALGGAAHFCRVSTSYVVDTGRVRIIKPAGLFSFVQTDETRLV